MQILKLLFLWKLFFIRDIEKLINRISSKKEMLEFQLSQQLNKRDHNMLLFSKTIT